MDSCVFSFYLNFRIRSVFVINLYTLLRYVIVGHTRTYVHLFKFLLSIIILCNNYFTCPRHGNSCIGRIIIQIQPGRQAWSSLVWLFMTIALIRWISKMIALKLHVLCSIYIFNRLFFILYWLKVSKCFILKEFCLDWIPKGGANLNIQISQSQCRLDQYNIVHLIDYTVYTAGFVPTLNIRGNIRLNSQATDWRDAGAGQLTVHRFVPATTYYTKSPRPFCMLARQSAT